jgi:DNA integrity scanning protein DisA with diadenylate cyclase activity
MKGRVEKQYGGKENRKRKRKGIKEEKTENMVDAVKQRKEEGLGEKIVVKKQKARKKKIGKERKMNAIIDSDLCLSAAYNHSACLLSVARQLS